MHARLSAIVFHTRVLCNDLACINKTGVQTNCMSPGCINCQFVRAAQDSSVRHDESADKREAGHSNVVVDMHIFTAPDGRPTGRISTAGWDGRVLLWQVDTDDRIKALH